MLQMEGSHAQQGHDKLINTRFLWFKTYLMIQSHV